MLRVLKLTLILGIGVLAGPSYSARDKKKEAYVKICRLQNSEVMHKPTFTDEQKKLASAAYAPAYCDCLYGKVESRTFDMELQGAKLTEPEKQKKLKDYFQTPEGKDHTQKCILLGLNAVEAKGIPAHDDEHYFQVASLKSDFRKKYLPNCLSQAELEMKIMLEEKEFKISEDRKTGFLASYSKFVCECLSLFSENKIVSPLGLNIMTKQEVENNRAAFKVYANSQASVKDVAGCTSDAIKKATNELKAKK